MEISAKKLQIWASEHHFGEVTSDVRPWLMAHWKAHVRLSVRVNLTVFTIYYGSGVTRRNMYSSAVFTGADLFALNFYLDRVVPPQPFLASENQRHWATW